VSASFYLVSTIHSWLMDFFFSLPKDSCQENRNALIFPKKIGKVLITTMKSRVRVPATTSCVYT
jgi:hypothetical protein